MLARKPALPCEEKKRMTLIVALRCEDDGVPGVAVCVDSQETIVFQGREYRVSRLKIKPKRCGNFDLAIAGSGNNGDAIDAAVGQIHDAVIHASATRLPELKTFIQSTLRKFRKDEARAFSRADLGFRLLICARSIEPQAVEVWITMGSQLEPMPEDPPYVMLGWEERLYEHELERAYSAPRSLMQATILGLHVLSIAKQTSRYVDRPFRVVVTQPKGMWCEDKAVVSQLEQRLGIFAPMLADLMLACPDTTMRSRDFLEKLSVFEAELLQLRADYIQAEGDRLLQGGSGKKKNPLPHLLLPKGSIAHFRVQNGRLVLDVDEDEVRTQKLRDEMREMRKWAEEQKAHIGKKHLPKFVPCSKCQKQFVVQVEDTGKAHYELEATCPHCGEKQKIEWNLPGRRR
jgi:hypothetical protein